VQFPLVSKIVLPRAASPVSDAVTFAAVLTPPTIDRTNATMFPACASDIGLGGIPVFGTPLRTMRTMSSSVRAVLKEPLLKSIPTILSPLSP